MPRSLPILVVDDTELCRLATALLLSQAGFSSHQSTNGSEAISRFESDRYGAVIMDVNMPDMTGAQCAQIMKSIERSTGRHVPIIGLTASYSPEVRKLCLAAGMDEVLDKTGPSIELIAVLESVLTARTR